MRLLTNGPGVNVGVGAGDVLCWIRGAAASTTTTTTNLTLSTKIPPPGVDQLWQHMFCQFGVAYCPPFHRFFAELGRVLGGVGLNGTVAEASAYPLL